MHDSRFFPVNTLRQLGMDKSYLEEVKHSLRSLDSAVVENLFKDIGIRIQTERNPIQVYEHILSLVAQNYSLVRLANPPVEWNWDVIFSHIVQQAIIYEGARLFSLAVYRLQPLSLRIRKVLVIEPNSLCPDGSCRGWFRGGMPPALIARLPEFKDNDPLAPHFRFCGFIEIMKSTDTLSFSGCSLVDLKLSTLKTCFQAIPSSVKTVELSGTGLDRVQHSTLFHILKSKGVEVVLKEDVPDPALAL